jgi:hypothetical protein
VPARTRRPLACVYTPLRRAAIVNRFLDFLVNEGSIASNPVADLHSIRREMQQADPTCAARARTGSRARSVAPVPALRRRPCCYRRRRIRRHPHSRRPTLLTPWQPVPEDQPVCRAFSNVREDQASLVAERLLSDLRHAIYVFDISLPGDDRPLSVRPYPRLRRSQFSYSIRRALIAFPVLRDRERGRLSP